MGSNGADKVQSSDAAEASETTIEIKIKTLDSQIYTLRVDKQMPVPALKEQIASVTGVVSEQQRLLCRGKVLKDDQLLSAYHVEDGHTLHLVVRQPVPPSSEGLTNHPVTDPVSSTSRGHNSQVSPSVVIETFSMPDQGDGVPPEINRIVSAVLGSFGFSNIGGGSEATDGRDRGPQRTSGISGTVVPTHMQHEQAGMRFHSDRSHSAFGLPATVSLGTLQPPVIPDSLTTLSQYLSHLRQEFDAIVAGRGEESNVQAAANAMHRTESTSHAGIVQEGLPTPASLAEQMMSTRRLLIEEVGESLLQLARQLESQASVTDPSTRMGTQSNAWRTGIQLQNLGAFILELGRTTMTLRLGQAPSEAVINAGPAVFISQSGPNPLMVQPLPFQPGSSFGAIPMGSVQPGTSLVSGLGTGFLPRRIDIQIRRGSSTAASNANREEHGDTQQLSGQRNSTGSVGENPSNQATSRVSEVPSFAGESGVRVVPIRTMVAAVPGSFSRLPTDSSSNSRGLYYPVLGRFQHVASGQVSGGQGSQAPGELHPADQPDGQLTPESSVQQQNIEGPARNGSLPTSNLGRQEPTATRSVNINILSAGGMQSNLESERQVPSSVVHLLRSLFPGGEIHVEDASLQETTTRSVPEQAVASSAPGEAEPRVSDEGMFLSNLLREIIPVISQHTGAEPNAVPSAEAQTSAHEMAQDNLTHAVDPNVGSSGRRQSDREPSPPNSKRQKME